MSDWKVDAGHLFWNDHLVKGADASTFEPLSETWARDSRNVYCQNKRIIGADVGTFEVLNPLWARDKGMAYYTYGRVKDADPSSFKSLDDGIVPLEEGYGELNAGYATDGQFVFHYLMTVGKPSKLPKADPSTFEVIGPSFGRDAHAAYYERFRIPGASPATLQHLGGIYSTDGNMVFYGNGVVVGAHPDSFVVARERFTSAHDRSRKYSRGQAI